jgi:hypothetical protein
MKYSRTLIAAFVALVCAGSAQASLVGNTVSCASTGFFTGCSPSNATVGAGVEFDVLSPVGGYHWSVDIGANSVVFTDLAPGSSSGGHGVVFLTGFDAPILGISNFATNATSGITTSDVTFTSTSITIDAQNSSWSSNQFISFNVVTADIPEPASLALVGLALVGLGVSRSRKQTAA